MRALPRRHPAVGGSHAQDSHVPGHAGRPDAATRAGRYGALHVGLRHRVPGRPDGTGQLGDLRGRIRKPRAWAFLPDGRRSDRAVRDELPGARERAGVHRTHWSGRLRPGHQHDPQGQPVPHGLRADMRASVRDALPPCAHRRAYQHPRHQALRGRPDRSRSGARSRCAARHRPPHRRHRRRPQRHDVCVLLRPHGAFRGRVRRPPEAGRHDALRNSPVPLSARAPRRGPAGHLVRRQHQRTLQRTRGCGRHGAHRAGIRCRLRGHRRPDRQDAEA